MLIKYVGFKPAVRTVGKYRWDAENNYTADVDDPAVIANLLTNRPIQGRDGELPCDFEVADDDPLKALGARDVHIAGLALAGVLTPAELAAQDPEKLHPASGVSVARLTDLIDKAKAVPAAPAQPAEPVPTDATRVTTRAASR